MKNRIISCALAFSMLVPGMTAYAGANDFETDFTGSVASKAPAGFDEWKSGVSLGSAPKLEVLGGMFGAAEDNVSIHIYSASGVGETKNPYIQKKNMAFTAENFSAGIKIAASDSESYKYAVLGAVDSSGTELEYPIAQMNPPDAPGALCAGNRSVESRYKTEQWYGIDLEFTPAKVSVYLNGEYIHSMDAADIKSVTYIKCGLSDKSAKNVYADVYLDDVYLREGGVDPGSLIELSAAGVKLDKALHTVSEIPEGADAESLIGMINAPEGIKLSVVNADGTAYEGTELKHGLYLKAVSANNVNSVMYFIDMADCHLVGLSNGDVLRSGDITLAVNSGSLSDIESISYYINGKPAGTVKSEPYELQCSLTEAGEYELYAEIKTLSGGITTPKINITYAPNKLPEVEIVSAADGDELAYDDKLTVKVTAEDSDGIVEKCRLCVDGAELVPDNEESPYVFTLNPISAGGHTMYAYAEDNEGGSAATAEIGFRVKRASLYTLSQMDFNKGLAPDFQLYSGSASFANVREDYGLSYNLIAKTGSISSAAYASSDPYLSSNTVIFECDYMVDAGSGKLDVIIKADSDFNTFTASSTPGEWYHLKFIFDLPKSTGSLYVNDRLINKASMKGKSFVDLRFNFSNTNTETAANAYIDNMDLYCELEYPYISDMQLLSETGSSVLTPTGEAGTDLKKIVLKFNTVLDESYAEKNNFKIYVNNAKDTAYDVSFRNADFGTEVVLMLRSAAKTNSLYKVIISENVSDIHSQPIGSMLCKSFKTGKAGFDVAKWSVSKGTKVITEANQIKKGDEIKLSAEFVNDGSEAARSVLIFAVYNGNSLIGYKLHEIDPDSISTGTVISDEFTVSDDHAGVRAEGYLWNSSGLAPEAAHFTLSN